MENVYKKFSSNEGNVIVLTADIDPADTKAIIVKAYQDRAKITPTFPIILAGQGGTSLAKLFTMPNTGGVEWIVLPSRKYSKSSYNEATLTSDINKALATGVQTVLFSTTVNSFSTKFSQNTISLSSPIEGNAMVKMLSLNGQTIYNWQGFLTKGSNVINLNTTLPQSFYIINVQKNDQTLYSSKLILK